MIKKWKTLFSIFLTAVFVAVSVKLTLDAEAEQREIKHSDLYA